MFVFRKGKGLDVIGWVNGMPCFAKDGQGHIDIDTSNVTTITIASAKKNVTPTVTFHGDIQRVSFAEN